MAKVHKHQEIQCPSCNRTFLSTQRLVICQKCQPSEMQSLRDPYEPRKYHQGPKSQNPKSTQKPDQVQTPPQETSVA